MGAGGEKGERRKGNAETKTETERQGDTGTLREIETKAPSFSNLPLPPNLVTSM